jgi:membrane protein DedA with SNARE-associated domain
VVPSLFFSLRTWVSGKGWFSVLVHSAWNGIFFAAGCATGDFTCTMADSDVSGTILTILLSAGLLAATYFLYRRKEKKERAIERNSESNKYAASFVRSENEPG